MQTNIPGRIVQDDERGFRLVPHVGSVSTRIFTGNVVLKKLTDRRIEHYRKLGKYGPVEVPAATGPRCRECQGTKGVKRCDFVYLPRAGYYCALCRDRYRRERDQERELSRRVRERRRQYE